jgi:DNA-binding LacI/PurR family transcriptional regulator/AraC-like DNA-binding protein
MEKRLIFGILGIADFRSSIGQDLIRGVLAGANEANIDILNCCCSTKYSVLDDLSLARYYSSYFKFMNRRNVDGIISWASSFGALVPYDEVIASHRIFGKMPLVALGIPLLDGVPGVFTDADYDISLVMNYLIRTRKYRRIGFYGSPSRPQYMRRLEAYRKCLVANDIPVDESIIFLTDSYDDVDAVKVVDRIVPPGYGKPAIDIEALVCVSDIIASFLISEFMARGVRVPEDIAITGFNNQIESMTAAVPMTTVDLCFYERGYRAVSLLLESIAARESGQKIPSVIYPSRLVIRQSCGQFENLITEAKYQAERLAEEITIEKDTDEGAALSAALKKALLSQGHTQESVNLDALVSAVVSDYLGTTENALLAFLRFRLHDFGLEHTAVSPVWNYVLTTIRAVVLSFADRCSVSGRGRAMENLLHQARIMVFIQNSYYITSLRHDAYKNAIGGQIAIEFATAMDIDEILSKLEGLLAQLEIPSITLALQEEMGPDLGECRVVYCYPRTREGDPLSGERYLHAGVIPPVNAASRGHQTRVMKILYYKDLYLGYVLIGRGPDNMAVYDMIQSLLTHSLYAIYYRNGNFRNADETQMLLRTKRIKNILEKTVSPEMQYGSLTAARLLEYLAQHLGSPTNLDTISRDLGISRSHLMRRAKSLTGYSIQVLHELLKIERAVILLERSPTTNIGEIASRLGFHNQSYFAKVFKKHKGLSPIAWRKHH